MSKSRHESFTCWYFQRQSKMFISDLIKHISVDGEIFLCIYVNGLCYYFKFLCYFYSLDLFSNLFFIGVTELVTIYTLGQKNWQNILSFWVKGLGYTRNSALSMWETTGVHLNRFSTQGCLSCFFLLQDFL